MKNQRYSTIRGGFASRPAARSTRLPIGLRLPSRPSCPIAFCSRPVHRPAIARRLSSLESRRRSPSFSLFRPACRIDGRGDALGGTEDGTADAIGVAQRKSQLRFSTIVGMLSKTLRHGEKRERHIFHTVHAFFGKARIPFFAISSVGFRFRSSRSRHMRPESAHRSARQLPRP